MEIIGYIAPFIVGGFFLWLAFLNFGREKYPTSTFLGVIAAFFILCSFPWFQGLAKTWIISNVNSKLKAMGEQIDQVQTTTGEMQSQLVTNQFQLATVQSNIITQQQKLGDVEYLVNNLFKRTRFETIKGSDTNRVCALSLGGDKKMIFVRLDDVPLPHSVQCMTSGGVFVDPLLSSAEYIQTYKNVAYFGMEGNADYKGFYFLVQYVSDPRADQKVHFVDCRTGSVFMDDILVPFHTNALKTVTLDKEIK